MSTLRINPDAEKELDPKQDATKQLHLDPDADATLLLPWLEGATSGKLRIIQFGSQAIFLTANPRAAFFNEADRHVQAFWVGLPVYDPTPTEFTLYIDEDATKTIDTDDEADLGAYLMPDGDKNITSAQTPEYSVRMQDEAATQINVQDQDEAELSIGADATITIEVDEEEGC